MNVNRFLVTASLILVAFMASMALLLSAQGQTQNTAQTIQAGNYRLSGPYTHKNLTIFLIHGRSIVLSKNFLTLQEALEQRKVIVYETKTVSELAIENISNTLFPYTTLFRSRKSVV